MKLTIQITWVREQFAAGDMVGGNAAFQPFDGQEIRRILSKLGDLLPDELSDMADQDGEVYRTLVDINGNRVGFCEVQA